MKWNSCLTAPPPPKPPVRYRLSLNSWVTLGVGRLGKGSGEQCDPFSGSHAHPEWGGTIKGALNCKTIKPDHRTASDGSLFSAVRTEKKSNDRRTMKAASWNERPSSASSNSRERSTALVALELHRYGIDIAALSETRLADSSQHAEKGADSTLFYQRRSAADDHRGATRFQKLGGEGRGPNF